MSLNKVLKWQTKERKGKKSTDQPTDQQKNHRYEQHNITQIKLYLPRVYEYSSSNSWQFSMNKVCVSMWSSSEEGGRERESLRHMCDKVIEATGYIMRNGACMYYIRCDVWELKASSTNSFLNIRCPHQTSDYYDRRKSHTRINSNNNMKRTHIYASMN